MGLGILALVKNLAPLGLYLLGLGCFFAALSGRLRWALLLTAFLLPLRNVIDKISDLPAGNQLIDILIIGMLFGWFISSLVLRTNAMASSSINIASVLLIVYTFISLQVGNRYLNNYNILDIGDPRVQDWKNFCLLPILYFLTLSEIKDKKWAWRLIAVMCVGMALSAYYTSTQISWFSSLQSRAKIHGTFQFLGPNEVASFFNQYSMILISIYFAMKRSRNKLLLMGLLFMNLYCIMFLYSRAAYAATAIGLMVLFMFKNKKLLVPLFLAAALWQVVLPEKAIERLQGTTNTYGEIIDESSLRRLEVWRESFNIFQNNPVAGLGFGTFRHLGFDLHDTHNIYIKIMVEQGIIGLFVFFVVIFCFLYEGWKLNKKGDDELGRALGFGFVVAIIVLLLNNFFGDRWSYLELSAYLWIFAALVARFNIISESAYQEKQAGQYNAKLKKLSQKNSLRESIKSKGTTGNA